MSPRPAKTPPKRPIITRRLALTGTAVAALGSGAFAANWFNLTGDTTASGALTVTDAFEQATAGQIYLIDIRRPDEWESTGVARPALPLDMRRADFEQALRALTQDNPDRPIALICARGVRSNRLNTRLQAAGFENLRDVPEGMLGSGAGPGYIASGLPLRAPTSAELNGQL